MHACGETIKSQSDKVALYPLKSFREISGKEEKDDDHITVSSPGQNNRYSSILLLIQSKQSDELTHQFLVPV
jgi:hypothetical protein